MNESLKDLYLEIIDKSIIEDNIKDSFRDFVETYNGTNEEEYRNFIQVFLSLILSNAKNSVKANAYDELKELQEKLKTQLEILDEDFDIIVNSKPIPEDELEDIAS